MASAGVMPLLAQSFVDSRNDSFPFQQQQQGQYRSPPRHHGALPPPALKPASSSDTLATTRTNDTLSRLTAAATAKTLRSEEKENLRPPVVGGRPRSDSALSSATDSSVSTVPMPREEMGRRTSQRRTPYGANDIFSYRDEDVGSRFNFIQEIGWGNWGSVWMIQSRKQSIIAACKLVHRDKTPTTAARVKALWQEYKVIRKLRDTAPHRGIIQFSAFIITPSYAMATMPYYSGMIPIALGEGRATARYFVRLIDAVGHLHAQGISHNDLKPANILLSSDDEPVIVDFGFSQAYTLPSPEAFLSQLSWGTPEYTSPERAAGQMHDERLADIWSLGVTMYEIVVGRTPFEKDEEEEFLTKDELDTYYQRSRLGAFCGQINISEVLEDLIHWFVEPKVGLRLQTATDALAHPFFALHGYRFVDTTANVTASVPAPATPSTVSRRTPPSSAKAARPASGTGTGSNPSTPSRAEHRKKQLALKAKTELKRKSQQENQGLNVFRDSCTPSTPSSSATKRPDDSPQLPRTPTDAASRLKGRSPGVGTPSSATVTSPSRSILSPRSSNVSPPVTTVGTKSGKASPTAPKTPASGGKRPLKKADISSPIPVVRPPLRSQTSNWSLVPARSAPDTPSSKEREQLPPLPVMAHVTPPKPPPRSPSKVKEPKLKELKLASSTNSKENSPSPTKLRKKTPPKEPSTSVFSSPKRLRSVPSRAALFPAMPELPTSPPPKKTPAVTSLDFKLHDAGPPATLPPILSATATSAVVNRAVLAGSPPTPRRKGVLPDPVVTAAASVATKEASPPRLTRSTSVEPPFTNFAESPRPTLTAFPLQPEAPVSEDEGDFSFGRTEPIDHLKVKLEEDEGEDNTTTTLNFFKRSPSKRLLREKKDEERKRTQSSELGQQTLVRSPSRPDLKSLTLKLRKSIKKTSSVASSLHVPLSKLPYRRASVSASSMSSSAVEELAEVASTTTSGSGFLSASESSRSSTEEEKRRREDSFNKHIERIIVEGALKTHQHGSFDSRFSKPSTGDLADRGPESPIMSTSDVWALYQNKDEGLKRVDTIGARPRIVRSKSSIARGAGTSSPPAAVPIKRASLTPSFVATSASASADEASVRSSTESEREPDSRTSISTTATSDHPAAGSTLEETFKPGHRRIPTACRSVPSILLTESDDHDPYDDATSDWSRADTPASERAMSPLPQPHTRVVEEARTLPTWVPITNSDESDEDADVDEPTITVPRSPIAQKFSFSATTRLQQQDYFRSSTVSRNNSSTSLSYTPTGGVGRDCPSRSSSTYLPTFSFFFRKSSAETSRTDTTYDEPTKVIKPKKSFKFWRK